MLSRIVSRLLILASLATLAFITYYFMDKYRVLRHRELAIKKIAELGSSQGPCAALGELRWTDADDAELQQGLEPLRSSFVTQVVGEDDVRGRRALLAAEREGLVDRGLCEEIRLSHEVGEVHPVLALLRYTREDANPCAEEPRLGAVLDGLGSHRPSMLRAIMLKVQRLGCLSPSLSEKVAGMVAEAAAETPALFDGMDSTAIATFVSERAPLGAAQLGCTIEARGQKSELGAALGCTPEKRRSLIHYRTTTVLPPAGGSPELAAGSDVVLLHEAAPFCEVTGAEGGAWTRTVACKALHLTSDLVLGVRIEALSVDASSFGRSDADLVAGLGAYAGASGKLTPVKQEPELHAWYAYDRDGGALGSVRRVDLGAALATLGEGIAEGPLRASCRKAGAKYCYDVDWAQAVTRVRGEPALYLSRPAPIFAAPEASDAGTPVPRFHEAFGRDPADGAYARVYSLSDGFELAVEASADDVALRWRAKPEGSWKAQVVGKSEAGGAGGSAHLLAVLDVQQDGLPELVLRRTRAVTAGKKKEKVDEVLLMQLASPRDTFAVLNRLTVHEY